MKENPITTNIDFDAMGIQHGHLKLPYSHDASAWGAIMIPIIVIKNNEGPTALFTGANHGDEYEGPIALINLAQTLSLSKISGRIILIPMMNYPAFIAGKRTSPIDSGNMNRAFPGKYNGTVTYKIADYFQRTLLPMADLVLDIHAGGKTLDFIPFAAAHYLEDSNQEKDCIEAMRAFNAPYSMMLKEIDSMGMYDTAAEDMGKIFVSTELGGGGSASAKSIAITTRGIRNLLKHINILEGKPEMRPSVNLDTSNEGCFITSDRDGLLEMCIDLGTHVKAGDLIAKIYETQRTDIQPREYHAKIEGILAARHFPGLIKLGDSLAVIATID